MRIDAHSECPEVDDEDSEAREEVLTVGGRRTPVAASTLRSSLGPVEPTMSSKAIAEKQPV